MGLLGDILKPRPWTLEEDEILIKGIDNGLTQREIALELNRSYESTRHRKRHLDTYKGDLYHFKESPYPVYDDPLVMEGNALVLPDLEMPFHDYEFLNKCLDLAQAWNVRQCIVAGDLLHFDSIASWEPNWIAEGQVNGLSEKDEMKLLEFANSLPEKHRVNLIDLVVSIGDKTEDGDPNISQELRVVRKGVKILSEIFDLIHFIIGNHDGRLIRALGSPMFPSEILRLVEAGDKWMIKPYYYSILMSNDEKFQIEHPRSAAKNSAYKLASKYQCHVLMAHSHRWSIDLDPSGKYYAIHMGCVVDENRLPYAAQRHSTADAHRLGACIVRDGYPFLLNDKSPWEILMRMK